MRAAARSWRSSVSACCGAIIRGKVTPAHRIVVSARCRFPQHATAQSSLNFPAPFAPSARQAHLTHPVQRLKLSASCGAGAVRLRDRNQRCREDPSSSIAQPKRSRSPRRACCVEVQEASARDEGRKRQGERRGAPRAAAREAVPPQHLAQRGGPRAFPRSPPAAPRGRGSSAARRTCCASPAQRAAAGGEAQRRHHHIRTTIRWEAAGSCCYECASGARRLHHSQVSDQWQSSRERP